MEALAAGKKQQYVTRETKIDGAGRQRTTERWDDIGKDAQSKAELRATLALAMIDREAERLESDLPVWDREKVLTDTTSERSHEDTLAGSISRAFDSVNARETEQSS